MAPSLYCLKASAFLDICSASARPFASTAKASASPLICREEGRRGDVGRARQPEMDQLTQEEDTETRKQDGKNGNKGLQAIIHETVRQKWILGMEKSQMAFFLW